MTTTSRFNGLAATAQGRTRQLANAYKGMADEMQRKQVVQPVARREPCTLAEAQLLILALRQENADLQALIDEMRAAANGNAPAAGDSTAHYDDCKTVAQRSDVAICTICRNAQALGGIKLGGDWLFPAGTVYGKRRKRKSK